MKKKKAISLKAVKMEIKSLKNYNSSDQKDYHQSTKVLTCGTKLFELIKIMFWKMLSGKKCRKNETKLRYLTIFKKGDRRKCENYRRMSVIYSCN